MRANRNRAIRHRAVDKDALVELGRRLIHEGKDDLGAEIFARVLQEDQNNLVALRSLGWLARRKGSSAAIGWYQRALRHYPDDVASLIGLANTYSMVHDMRSARKLYKSALEIDPSCLAAHRGLATAFVGERDWSSAVPHLQKGFPRNHAPVVRYRGTKKRMPRVLLIVSPLGGNLPTRTILDDRIFKVIEFPVEQFSEIKKLPTHDVIFNAIGDADLREEIFPTIQGIARRSRKPIINAPRKVLATQRLNNFRRVSSLPGVIAPNAAAFRKGLLMAGDVANRLEKAQLRFPLLVRSPGFHGGRHLVKVNNVDQLRDSIERLPGEELLVIEFLDARSDDGFVRKYRCAMIDGVLYPVALTPAMTWKAHLKNSLLPTNAALRREEDLFLNHMPDTLHPVALSALKNIQNLLHLDYAGIDFSVAKGGSLIFFEANATMALLDASPEPMWSYRTTACENVLRAAQRMVMKRTFSSRGGARRAQPRP